MATINPTVPKLPTLALPLTLKVALLNSAEVIILPPVMLPVADAIPVITIFAVPVALPLRATFDNVLLVKVCVVVTPTVAKPPVVAPSCTLTVLSVVSMVISPKAPVKLSFCAVVPRLYCICVDMFYSYSVFSYETMARSVTLRQFVPSENAGTAPPDSSDTNII